MITKVVTAIVLELLDCSRNRARLVRQMMRFDACAPQRRLPLGSPWAEAGGQRWFAERGGAANSVVALAAHTPGAQPALAAAPQLAIAGGVLSALPCSGLYWPAPAMLRATSVVPLETVPSTLVPSSLTSPASYQEQCSTVPAALWCRGKQQLRVKVKVKGAISVRSKMRAPSAPAPRSPCSKKAPRINSYAEFCREQRPLLPTSLRNAERERVLGQRWRTLSEFERANWRSSVPAPDSSPAPAPTAVLGAAPTFSTDLGTAAPSTPVVAAPVPARATPPSVGDARAQAPTTVHAPAAPNSPAARVASANNRLMMLLSEADNDTVMELMHAEEYFQSSTPVCAKAPPQA